jgi:DNA-binding transcriptional ArsR family regulator
VDDLDLAGVAALFANPSRARMIELLLDGREHSLAGLAVAAGVGRAAAHEHLARLEEGGLVVSRRLGRERLVRLRGPGVAAAHEALAQLTRPTRARGLRGWSRHEQLRAARTCYDHLAGRLGVALAAAAQGAGALDADYALGTAAPAWFGQFGVELEELRRLPRPLLRVCSDWTERRPHLAGALGAAVCSGVLGAGWVSRRPGSRALALTSHGQEALARLGIEP